VSEEVLSLPGFPFSNKQYKLAGIGV
jgi:hypothetical protein